MPFSRHPGMGDTAQAVAGGLLAAAPLTGPAAPFVALAGTLVNLGDSIAHLFSHYDPAKLKDTAIVEAFEMAGHTILYQVTGEALPGIPGVTATAQPGNYGSSGINLFQDSAYPNVPYPAGAPGVDAGLALQSLTATYQNFAGQLVRQESAPNLANNYRIMAGVLQKVADAQGTAAPSGTLGGLLSQIPGWVDVAGAVALGWALLRRLFAHECTEVPV